MSGLGINAIFSALIGIEFAVHIPLMYKHLFYKYFVRRSVGQATEGRNVKIWKRNFLSPN